MSTEHAEHLAAAALAGPPELGRSVLVYAGTHPPAPWAGCERFRVSFVNFSAETGRRLRHAWLTRTRLVIELDPDADLPDAAAVWRGAWWELTPGLTMRAEVLAHLLTANVVDARRPGEARFAPVDAAVRLGAQRATDALWGSAASSRSPAAGNGPAAGGAAAGDVTTEYGAAWCDGGPLDAFDLPEPVIPAANLAVGSLRAVRRTVPDADLAADQHAAVGHLGGASCIVAPAGSGKTRVLTERARYLVRDLGIAAEAVCLVAFNVRARREMQQRTSDLAGLQVRTLNSLALAICNGTGPFARPQHHGKVEVADEMAVRDRLDAMIKRRRRAMTDQLAPWLEALSASRLGLRDPVEVERDFQPDVPDFAAVAPRLVQELAAEGLVDFDQQIIRAIEILLVDPRARATARRVCGVLLVDEFQDLTPAHLLLVRLLAGPRADVFGVGDDDQTIYGYSGASPRWLIDYHAYFPGATQHRLRVNYRCPAEVVRAAVNLLSHNRQRVDKDITAHKDPDSPAESNPAESNPADGAPADGAPAHGMSSSENALPGRPGGRPALVVHAEPDAAAALRDTVETLLAKGVQPRRIAVLTRVNSTLLVPQIVLGEMGVPSDAPVSRTFLGRTGVASALAWLRLALAPTRALPSGALMDAARRPPRGLSPRVIEWIGEQRSTGALRALAGRLKDERSARKIEALADDIELLSSRTGAEQLTTEQILETVRDELGLGGSLDTRLDASRRSVDRSAHGDDLRALISVAHLHPDPAGFAVWLSDRLSSSTAPEADADSFGADAFLDSDDRAPDGIGTAPARRRVAYPVPSHSSRSPDAGGAVRLATIHKVKGLEWPHVIVYEASAGLMPHRLSHDLEEERRVFHVALTRCSASVTLICGDQTTSFVQELSEFMPRIKPEPETKPEDGPSPGALLGAPVDAATASTGASARSATVKPDPPADPASAALYETLKAWRRERSKADGVPPYVVFHNSVLIEIANRQPASDDELLAIAGVGPAKLERYGKDVAALLAEHRSGSA